MKRLIIFLLAVGFATGLNAQKIQATADPLSLKSTTHHFGKIPQGRPVTHLFQVVNTSKVPLVLNTVEASCGCTTPEWSQEPVAPGEITHIKVGFNAATEGPFSKTITVTYNDKQVKTLVISGEVFPSPATPAPLNTSLSTLIQ